MIKSAQIMIIGCLLAALVLPISTALADDDTPAWTVIADLNLEQHIFVASFTSPTTGITSGYGGATYVTTDGGETWTQAENESACRYGIAIVNDSLAWTSGNYGHVRRSTDNGLTWSAVENVGYTGVSSYISFADEQNGWVASGDKIWTTVDSGETWAAVPLLEEMERVVAAVARVSADEGFVLTYTPKLYHTTDGGETWTSMDLGTADDHSLAWLSKPALRMFDAEHGMIALQLKDQSSIVLRTDDGGASWTEEVLPVELDSTATYVFSPDGQLLTITISRNSQAQVIVIQHQTAVTG